MYAFSHLVLCRITAKERLETGVKTAVLQNAFTENISTGGTKLKVYLLMIVKLQEKFFIDRLLRKVNGLQSCEIQSSRHGLKRECGEACGAVDLYSI